MSEEMNLSVNGQSKVPPGFRFHPTEEELLHYYLRKKVAYEKIDLDVIRDVDLNKLEPWDIQEKCKIGSTPQNDWYFFSHKDKKYPTGTRTNRATAAGFWKATGRDKVIHSNFRRIGMRKTLVFYRGRAPHGQKSDWIMHEYRLDENNNSSTSHEIVTNGSSIISGDSGPEEGWVVCRVFKKKNYHKALDSGPSSASILSRNSLINNNPRNDGVLDHILTYMGSRSSSCKHENENLIFPNQSSGSFVHLPGLESPNIESCNNFNATTKTQVNDVVITDHHQQMGHQQASNDRLTSDWVALDRLVASQLNGQPSKNLISSYGDDDDFSFSFDQDEVQLLNMNGSDRGNIVTHHQAVNSNSDADFWNFGRESSSLSSSSSDPLCHLSV